MQVHEISIPEQKSFDEVGSFPLVLSPKEHVTAAQTVEWVNSNRPLIQQHLNQHGAVLFRGFGLSSAEHFDNFAVACGYENFPYVGGAAPRNVVYGGVHTTNESPPHINISYHHEMAQVPNWPKKLFFYCQTPPASGGETPLVVSNEVYKRALAKFPDFVAKLEKEGVLYIRVMSPEEDNTSPIGRSWKATFGCADKAAAEKKCDELNLKYEWLGDNMKTVNKIPIPGVQIDERTGKKVWFNSIVAAFTQWNDSRNKGETAVAFGNGEFFDPKHVLGVKEIMDEIAVCFKWQKGDVVLVDNRQALHARRPFTPPRDIYAWLTKS